MQPAIIIVDDEKIILNTLKAQLKTNLKNDYTIEMAESGEEALEILDELISDGIEIPLVISDQIMPGLKGNELLKSIHTKLPKTLTVLLTGQADAEAVGNAVNSAKLYRYIGKPWDETDLLLTVKEAIRSYFQDKDLESKNVELKDLNIELKKKVETFYKFVPTQFLEILEQKEFEEIKLGVCTECNLSVMFSDIRSFTKLSERISPQENIKFLNSYLANMGPIIRKHHGFIDKFIGDAVMGLFQNPDNSVQAAIAKLIHLKQYNIYRKKTGYVPIKIGIGINTGFLMLGTIGENNRIETTVIGDVVNLASRIERLTKIYHTPILISEYTMNGLEDISKYSIRFIDKVKVKGRDTLVNVFEVFDADTKEIHDGKIKTMEVFKEAIKLYKKNDYSKCYKLFSECLNINPGDQVVKVYLKKLKAFK